MNADKTEIHDVRRECIEFPLQCRRVLVASQNPAGQMDVDSAPFIKLDNDFYLYLSQCSAQSDNMVMHGVADLMFIEDEMTSPLVFSRRRMCLRCDAEVVGRGYRHTRILVAFQERFGSFMDILRNLPDFRLFQITPRAGRYTDGRERTFTFQGSGVESLRDHSLPRRPTL